LQASKMLRLTCERQLLFKDLIALPQLWTLYLGDLVIRTWFWTWAGLCEIAVLPCLLEDLGFGRWLIWAGLALSFMYLAPFKN
jgi:hypothetical protein